MVAQNLSFDKVLVLDPVGYFDMLVLLDHCRLVMTDSGGLQKEAYFFKKFCVTLREETEWVEIIEAGNGILTGANPEKIISASREFLDSPPKAYPPIFGDGHAARHILNVLTSANW